VDDSFHAYLGLSSDSHLYSVERLPNADSGSLPAVDSSGVYGQKSSTGISQKLTCGLLKFDGSLHKKAR